MELCLHVSSTYSSLGVRARCEMYFLSISYGQVNMNYQFEGSIKTWSSSCSMWYSRDLWQPRKYSVRNQPPPRIETRDIRITKEEYCLHSEMFSRLYMFLIHIRNINELGALWEISGYQATSVKMAVFWDIAPCSLVEIGRRFRGALWPHIRTVSFLVYCFV